MLLTLFQGHLIDNHYNYLQQIIITIWGRINHNCNSHCPYLKIIVLSHQQPLSFLVEIPSSTAAYNIAWLIFKLRNRVHSIWESDLALTASYFLLGPVEYWLAAVLNLELLLGWNPPSKSCHTYCIECAIAAVPAIYITLSTLFKHLPQYTFNIV